jgi:hypothetical protein
MDEYKHEPIGISHYIRAIIAGILLGICFLCVILQFLRISV